MNHQGTKVLETERLILRPFAISDAPAMYQNWASDPVVTRCLTWPTHTDESGTRALLSLWAPKYADKDFYNWAVELKELGEPIGSIGVVRADEATQAGEIGYCIGRRWWRRGIMSEALSAVIRYLFEDCGFARLEARHDAVTNPNSGRVMAHCGMVREGVLRRGGHANQGVFDCAIYGLLAEDYRRLSAKTQAACGATVHQGTKALTTERLILRPFTMDDASAMYRNWGGDLEVNRFMTWPLHRSEADSCAVLTSWIADYAKPDFYNWAIVLKSLGEPIGGISVVRQNAAAASAEVGYCIGNRWWRQGITSEALAAVIRFLFEEVGLNRVEARYDPRNLNSGRVMAHCGMTREGTMRQADVNNQGICDYTMYGMLAKEYFKLSYGR
jgi:ribosomal-protein-alanine N-acetyltransferase